MKRSIGMVSLFSVLLLSSAAFSQNAGACSAASLQGSFGFVSSIRMVPPPNSTAKHTERARFIGVIAYDGAGNVAIRGGEILPDGTRSPYAAKGTYTVDTDCTGIATLQFSKSEKWDFVIVANGTQLLTMIETAPSTTPFMQIRR